MASWTAMQKKLLAYAARNPQVRKMMDEGMNRASKHPAFIGARQKMQATYHTIREKAKAGSAAAASGRSGATKGGPSSGLGTAKDKMVGVWSQYKKRIFAFIATNFMLLIVALQFGQALWQMLTEAAPQQQYREKRRQALKQAEASAAEEAVISATEEQTERKKRKNRQIAKRIEAEDGDKQMMSSVETGTSASYFHAHQEELTSLNATNTTKANSKSNAFTGFGTFSMFDDTVAGDGNYTGTFGAASQSQNAPKGGSAASAIPGQHIDFSTSFLVKMGDEKEFTSALEREDLVGKRM